MNDRAATVELTGGALTVADVAAVAARRARVTVAPDAFARMQQARDLVEKLAAGDAAVYGVNTGFGALAEVKIPRDDLLRLQRNLILSHAAGVGPPLSPEETRALMLLRMNVLAGGYSGVRPVVLETLGRLLDADILPIVPEIGSVGASGDLAPLAHVALGLIGEGDVWHDGAVRPAADALRDTGITPVTLQAKEGICLINGTQAMGGLGCLAQSRAEDLAALADIAGAMSLEGWLGTTRAFDPRIMAVRPHPGQATTAANLRALLADSEIWESHINCGRVQDPYSFRCMPQVHGATRDTLAFTREVLTREINAATDNPLVFAADDDIISGGNFHGQPLALALDFMAIAVAELGSISERRIEQLVNPALSGLPPFLARDPGRNSGFMLAQVTAAALVNESKIFCTPASVDSIPTSAGREDHVSMGMTSARKLRAVINNVRRVLAIEVLCAAQALDFRKPLKAGRGAETAWACVRSRVGPWNDDRLLHKDIARVDDLLASGALLAAVRGSCANLS